VDAAQQLSGTPHPCHVQRCRHEGAQGLELVAAEADGELLAVRVVGQFGAMPLEPPEARGGAYRAFKAATEAAIGQ
jgi:hypothetical protein